jgi:hypothetical protein
MAGFNSFRGGGSLPDSKDRGITENEKSKKRNHPGKRRRAGVHQC